jgi:hypothetical protein
MKGKIQKMEQTTDNQEGSVKLKGIQIEEEMIKAEAEALANHDPLDSMYTLIGLYSPKFSQVIDKLKSKELRRLIKHLVTPLDHPKTKFSSNEGKAASALGKRLLDCAYTLMIHAQAEALDKAQKEQTALTEEQNKTNNNEETKGNE